MKVAKFGGSSVADAAQFKKVKAIIESDTARKIVVVSAAGKSKQEPVKITDMLIKLKDKINHEQNYQQQFAEISERFIEIRNELQLKIVIENDLQEIENNLNNCSYDYLISRGEYLTAKLMAEYLGYYFLDAKNILIFNGNEINYSESAQQIQEILVQYPRVVVPGFYGANGDGSIHLMPRGGSDISGSILANLVDAKLYENWTDVSGILMADPRIVDHSKKIDVLTYDELQELSYMGIGVFQDEAVRPVRQKQIPTKILNTNHPEEGGTLVVDTDDKKLDDRVITGIAGKKNYTVITIKKYQLNKHIETLQKILSIFQKLKVSINYIPSGNDGFSFLCQSHDIGNKLNDIIDELKQTCHLDSVEVNRNIALVAAVSLQLSKRPAIAGKILNFLDDSLIHVRFVFQEGSDIKVVIGVSNSDYEKTIARIYQESLDSRFKKIPA
ncbi:aspartate kinase [Companilactobacillus kimchiensis]|uniref:Aspartokinase n=1 Tax=Companilactobacillus kimchiensis TaxID=993692 RepID=A0A0R2LAG4_9LACO|nr:aspartate kinase [Companilactobacillus kimchiensis]KRN98417.1 aspartate kinase [Companilactobacillus kimchiensis]